MSSDAKRAANRKNACKSTGPRTDRGKTKSRFNALKYGIHAMTPVFPGEDVGAYCEMEKLSLEHFAPIGPVENMLVREITREAWRLERIQRAEIALYKHLRDGQIVRFLRSLSDDEMVYVKSAYKNDLDDQIIQRRQQIVAEIRGEIDDVGCLTVYTEPEELGEMPDEDEKRDVDARLCRVLEVDNTILAGLVPKTESAPLSYIDRERRAAVRAYCSHVAKLQELQEARLTVTVIPVPVAGKEVKATASASREIR